MTDLYCARHRTNHHLTGLDTEDLIQGLLADVVDAASDNDYRPGYEPDFGEPFTLLAALCPRELVRAFRDPEMYAEHLEAMWESRRVVAYAQVVQS